MSSWLRSLLPCWRPPPLQLSSVAIAHPCRLEIDPNEAWNAWQSKSLARLYPAADALTVNNYPPLYFYLLHAFSSLGAEEIYAGRVISILASLALTFLVYRAILILGAGRLAAGLGAIWFLATLAGAYTGYVGMNDPHLLGLAVMCAGFTWFVARANKRAADRTGGPLDGPGRIHQTQPYRNPGVGPHLAGLRQAARGCAGRSFWIGGVCGRVACLPRQSMAARFLSSLCCRELWDGRIVHLALTYAAPLLGAAAICIAWLVYDRRSRLAQKIAVLLLLTFISGFVQSLGDGLDVNAYFEFLFALAIGIGMAFSKIQAWPASVPRAAGIRLAFAAVLLIALSFSSQSEPYKFAFSREFRQDVAENVDAVRTEIKRLKKMPGSVSCSVMLVCYWAGKPFVWDDFAMRERVATGRWTEAEMKRQARLHRIRFETIDDRTVW